MFNVIKLIAIRQILEMATDAHMWFAVFLFSGGEGWMGNGDEWGLIFTHSS